MINKNKIKNILIIIIPITTLVIALIIVLNVIKVVKPTDKTIEENTSPNPVITENTLDGYYNETVYKGNLSEYPELYQYPFKRTDAYVSNKAFFEGHEDVIKELNEDSKAFMEKLFNVNYINISKDIPMETSTLCMYCDYTQPYTYYYDDDREKTVDFYEYLYNILEDFVENKVQAEAEFITDESLVYYDHYTYCRGELIFTIYECVGESYKGYKKGEEYKLPMEVVFERSNNNPDNRVVVGFFRTDDESIYLIPQDIVWQNQE